MRLNTYNLCTLLYLMVPATATSANQQAHTHGLATLTMAIENEAIDIQLESPAVNLIGFEHKARSKEEKQKVKEALSVLSTSTEVFSFVGTACRQGATAVDSSGVSHHEHKTTHHHDHHDHDHHHKSEGHESQHNDISVTYRFNCKSPKKLEAVIVTAFKHFPGIEKIKVLWVSEKGQGTTTLNAKSNTIPLQ